MKPTPPHTRRYLAEWIALIAALAVAAALVAVALLQGYERAGATERDRLQVQARVIDENLAQQLDGINKALVSVRADFLDAPAGHAATTAAARLRSLTDAMPGVRTMLLLDAHGTVLAASEPALVGQNFAQRDYFGTARAAGDAGALYLAPPFRSVLGHHVITVARVIADAYGNFGGVVVAALDSDYFEVVMRSVLYAADMWAALGHGDGNMFLMVPPDPRLVGVNWTQPGSMFTVHRQSSHPADLLTGTLAPADEERIVAFRSVAPLALRMNRPLVIAVSREVAAVYLPWQQQALEYGAFFALLALATALGLYRSQSHRRAFDRLAAAAEQERRAGAERLELALQGADLGLWDWDVAADCLSRNDELTLRQLGYTPGEIGAAAAGWRELIHPFDAIVVAAAIKAHFDRDTEAYECEFRVRHKAGHWVWLLSRAKLVERDAADAPLRMVGTHMDISERKRAEAEIAHAAEMLRRTGKLAKIGGWEIDLATRQLNWTEEVYRIHEVEPETSVGLDEALDFFAPEAREQVRAAVQAAIDRGLPWDLELPFVTAKRRSIWVRTQGMPILHGGKAVRLVGAFQDVTDRKKIGLELEQVNERLTRLSTTDALTEVGNRRLFDQTLVTEWARAARRNEAVALLMIDIDHFKAYNDHYGQPAGDACLRRVARLIAASAQRGGELVARYGGEEFAVLLPATDLAGARLVAQRCMQVLADEKIAHAASPVTAWLTLSIGVASEFSAAALKPSLLVEAADAALYRAKHGGRNRFES